MTHVFRGRTLTEAKKAAEATLGADVVVLHSRKVKRAGFGGFFGGTEFEIRAGVPVHNLIGVKEKPPVVEEAQPDEDATWNASHPFARSAYDDDQTVPRGGNKLEDEMRTMRAMMYRMSRSPSRVEGELANLRRAVGELSPRGSSARRVQQLLTESGIDGDAAQNVMRALRKHKGDDDSLVDAYRDALIDLISVKAWPLESDVKTVIGVVGPPGVGKTTTAAKIAARAIGVQGRSVTFVSCDTYRVGAVDQIKQYAKLLSCKLYVVKSVEAMHKAIRSADTDFVIVDTAGRGPTDEQSPEAALGEERLSRGRPTGWENYARHVLLCVDASLRGIDAERVWQRYSVSSPTALAITKLDLTSAPGGLIHAPVCSSLPVSTLCMGQRVPEDISPATRGRILDYVVPRGSARLAS